MTTAACEEEHCVSLSDWLSAGKHGAQNRAHISRLDGEWISSFINGETGDSGGAGDDKVEDVPLFWIVTLEKVG